MLPYHWRLGAVRIEIWDLVLAVGIVAGYAVLRASFAAAPGKAGAPRALLVRYLVTVYVAVLGAQLFSYAFDAGTTLVPPRGRGWAAYYLNPLAGAKTLYGAVLVLPLAVAAVWLPKRDRPYRALLDGWTPALLAVLASARVGCLLQGCCYGVRSDLLGVRFAAGSVLYHAQHAQGLIEAGAPSLPVLPTQAISAVVIGVLALAAHAGVRAGQRHVFEHAIAGYSLFRLLIEWLRDDPARNYLGPLSTSQWIATAILAAYALWRLRVRSRARL